MRTNLLRVLFVFVAFILTPYLNAKELNIYSHRQPFLINPFLELFTQETGIKTNVVYSKKGLAQRLKAEVKIVQLMLYLQSTSEDCTFMMILIF